MNVLHINTIDNRGGAAIQATRLRLGLIQRGINSTMIVAKKTEESPDVYQLSRDPKKSQRNRLFKLAGLNLPTFAEISQHEFFKQADIIHFHNLHAMPDGYFDIRALAKLSQLKPAVWTLHDAWIVYELGGAPEYGPLFRQESRLFLHYKQKAIKQTSAILVANSEWLQALTLKYYPDKDVRMIRGGVDISVFKPIDKLAARRKLKLNPRAKLVLFVANEGEDNIPKGTVYLKEARDILSKEGIEFISLGSTRQNTYVSSEQQMALYYSAADVFALPSLAESSSMTIAEAMACGTPAVAFRTGGIPNTIDHLKNGYLAKYKDSQDFTAGLRLLLTNRQLHAKLSKNSIAKIKAEFTTERMLDKYIDLYASII